MSKILKPKIIKPFEYPKTPDILWTPWGGLRAGKKKAAPKIRLLKKTRIKTKDWQIVKGDFVQILAGKDKGKQGKIIKVTRQKDWVYVEGLNAEVHYIPEEQGQGQAYSFLKSEPLDVKDVALVDPTDQLPCTTVSRFTATGEKVRVSTRTGRIIGKAPWTRSDFKTRDAIQDGSYDTPAADAQKTTYTPSLLQFHEEIMLSLNVKPTVVKTELDKRDLIFKHLEQEAKQDSEQLAVVQQPGLYLSLTVYLMSLITRVKKLFTSKK